MPPEQITHFRDVRPAADQYSAAATLYTLLTGRCIHDLPKTVADALVHIAVRDPVPIRQRRPEVPKGLAEVIHTALAREPRKRFRDVEEFREALAEWA
jgi:serine/threonine-protein kinase